MSKRAGAAVHPWNLHILQGFPMAFPAGKDEQAPQGARGELACKKSGIAFGQESLLV